MALLTAWIAILVPWALASVIVRHTCFSTGPGSVAASIGYGFFLGVLFSAGLFGLQGHFGLPLNPWPLIAVMVTALVAVSWRVRSSWLIAPNALRQALWPEFRWSQVLTVAVMAWVAFRVATLAYAVSTYSLFPWDAWTTWALRAKVWTELGQWVPFVAPDVWLADVDGVSRTTAAWHYPELPSWISAWTASATGAWNERAANAPALGALLALLAATFGQLRRWGAPILAAWVAVWLLVSIPLVGSHVALAGYADLWVAATLGLSFMAFLSWIRDGGRSQLVLTISLIILTALLKKEALVWVCLFVPAWLVGRLSARAFWLLSILVIGSLLALAQTQAFTVRIPMLGEFVFAAGGEWRWVLLQGFVFGNWHLFGYLVIGLLALSMVELIRGRAEPWLRSGITWVFGALLGFYVLFFWTAAAEWAIDGTSLNRILLQFTPAILFLAMALWTSRIPAKEPRAHA
jgi:hypothetical protein